MKNTDNASDFLPDVFISEEEAGEFWDSHSTADYESYLKPADMTIDIKERHYIIELDKENFMALYEYAKKINQPLKTLVNTMVKEKLASVC